MSFFLCFFFNPPATPEIYTYRHTPTLHDSLPSCLRSSGRASSGSAPGPARKVAHGLPRGLRPPAGVHHHGDRHPGGARRRLLLPARRRHLRSEEHTYELQSLMRNSYAVFCLKKKKTEINPTTQTLTEL